MVLSVLSVSKAGWCSSQRSACIHHLQQSQPVTPAGIRQTVLAVKSSSRLYCSDVNTSGICTTVSLQARGSESLQDVARLFGLSAGRVLADNQGVITEANQALGGRSILLCGQHGELHVSTLGVNEYMLAQCVWLVCSSQGSKCRRNMQ
jgi:hypothetical protein